MKNKNRLAFKLAIALAVFVTLGCGGISQLLPTPTPVFTSTPTITPSPTPTLTPIPTLTSTPLPDISAARISLSELPKGFEELSPEELGLNKATAGGNALNPQVTFAFVNTRHFQMIFGMNFFVAGKMDRVGFDVAMNQPEIALKQMASGMGAQNVHDEKILTGLEDVGEMQIAMTMVSDMKGVPMRVDIVVFRRDIIGAILISMTMEGQKPNISLHDLGKLFDQNIQKTLQTIQ